MIGPDNLTVEKKTNGYLAKWQTEWPQEDGEVEVKTEEWLAESEEVLIRLLYAVFVLGKYEALSDEYKNYDLSVKIIK